MTNNNTTTQLPKLYRNDVATASTITKLNKSKMELGIIRPEDYMHIVKNNMDKLRNNDAITELFPDVEKCIQILTASIISPNNMLSTKITYTLPTIKLPDTVKAGILSLIDTYIDKNYELEDKLPDILREAYFTKGAWAQAIVSEAAVDEIINPAGMASDGKIDSNLIRKMTREELGSSKHKHSYFDISNESLNLVYEDKDLAQYASVKINPKLESKSSKNTITLEDLNIEFVSDPAELFLKERLYKHRTNIISTEGLDFNSPIKYDNLYSLFRVNDGDRYQEVVSVTNTEHTYRESTGKAMFFKIPTESIIPIHVVNDTSKHLGYFVMLDEKGSPVCNEANVTEEQLTNLMRSNVNQTGQNSVISRARNAIMGMTGNEPRISNIEEIYNKVVDDTIRKAIQTTGYDDLVSIRDNADIYRVMFFRSLKAKRTRLLYIPAENLIYYAFDYRDNGTGKSLIEKTAMLHSIRSILLFTKVLSSIKNSTTTTKLGVTLDENDPDPAGTIDMIRSEYIKTRSSAAPFGLLGVNNLIDWAQSAGMVMDVKGNSGLPDMTIDISEQSTSKVIPDESTDEMIRSHIYMAYGLSPEIVESGYSADFATTVVAKNLLFAKQTLQIQKKLMKKCSKHVSIIIKNDYELRDRIKNIVSSNITDIKNYLKKSIKESSKAEYQTLEDENIEMVGKMKDDDLANFILLMISNDIVTELPKPETTEAQALHDAFQAFKTALEDNIEAMFPSEVMNNELIGITGDKVDVIKGILKVVMIRKWMVDNDYMPELSDFIIKDDGNNYVFNAFGNFQAFVSGLGDSLQPFLKEMNKLVAKLDGKLEKVTDASDGDGSDNFGDSDDAASDGDIGDGATDNDTDNTNDDFIDDFSDDTSDQTDKGDPVEEDVPEEKDDAKTEEKDKEKEEGVDEESDKKTDDDKEK